MRVLLFAYYFPPDGGAGTQRPASFARHLSGLGARCSVITRACPRDRSFWEPEDASLLAEVESCARVRRTPTSADSMEAFLAAVEHAAEEEVRQDRPDAILATLSPFPMWRPVAAVARRHRIPVAFDLRDPWALDGWQSYRTWLHWRLELAEMRRMLRRADGVIANTAESRTLFLNLERKLDPRRCVTITNGWNRDDFPEPAPATRPLREANREMRLVFSGTFLSRSLFPENSLPRRLIGKLRYSPEPIDPTGRTPLPLLRAIRLLRDRREQAGSSLRLVIVGQRDPWTERCVQESGVQDAVSFAGYQRHSESIRYIREADALFLPLHGLPPGHRSRIIPGKAYEYLATGRPILAALPEGDAAELLERTGLAFFANPCCERSLANAIKSLHAGLVGHAFDDSRRPAIAADYERRVLTEQLLAFLRSLT